VNHTAEMETIKAAEVSQELIITQLKLAQDAKIVVIISASDPH